MVKAAGTVYRGESQERAIAAVVKAKPAAGAFQFVVTDDDGDFEFPDLAAGTWTFQALDEASSPSAPLDLDLQSDQTDLKLSLRRTMDVEDERLGVWFFAGLIAALLILIAGYIFAHQKYSPKPEPLSGSLLELVDQTAASLTATPQGPNAVASVTLLRNSLVAVLTEKGDAVSSGDRATLTQVADDIVQAVNEDHPDIAASDLTKLRALIVETPSAETAVFWTDPPGRYFEVMLWGLAGVLVSLILTVATYLRWGRFYREGWVLHVAQLVVVPLLTLVVVALLSLTEFSLTVGSSEIKIDLDDPLLLAMISFLVAFGPWNAVRSLRETSSRLMSSTPAPSP